MDVTKQVAQQGHVAPPVGTARLTPTKFILVGIDYMERVIGTAMIEVEPDPLVPNDLNAASEGWKLVDGARSGKGAAGNDRVPWYDCRAVIVVDPVTGDAKSFDRSAPPEDTWEVTER